MHMKMLHFLHKVHPFPYSGAGSAPVSDLSQSGNDGSQDIDQARVDELRQAIAEGRLEIRADRIADGLIASVQDLLGGEQP